jgi:hypothetical protein
MTFPGKSRLDDTRSWQVLRRRLSTPEVQNTFNEEYSTSAESVRKKIRLAQEFFTAEIRLSRKKIRLDYGARPQNSERRTAEAPMFSTGEECKDVPQTPTIQTITLV